MRPVIKETVFIKVLTKWHSPSLLSAKTDAPLFS